MSPDDPRHGTYAGAQAHRKYDEPACEACADARRRHDKRVRVLGSAKTYVRLGEAAHRILTATPRVELERAGILSTQVTRLRRGGPDITVTLSTRQRVHAAAGQHITITGARRRLQALAALGWSSEVVAERCGIHPTSLNEIRRGERRQYVHRDVAEAIGRVYDALSMTIPEPSRSVSWTRSRARANGYLPPLAWEDERIDDPDYRPVMRREGSRIRELDPVVVERVLSGERMDATPAEKAEVIRRWRASGRSLNDLERLTGINPHRGYREAS